MKRILLSLLAIMTLGIFAVNAEEFVLGGCNHKIITGSGYGTDNAGEIAAAMYIPGSKLKSLAGNVVSRIDVGLVSRINVKNLNVWVRESLDGENKALEVIERPVVGWNEVNFSKPYTIPENSEGIYIGYSYENAGSSHPVSFIGNGAEYPSYLKISGAKWEDMSQHGALSIEAVVTGKNLPQYDISLLSGNLYPNINGGENSYIITGEASNLALKEITGFDLSVTKEERKIANLHVSVNIARGETVTFIGNFETDTPLAGEVELMVYAIDGGVDADPANNSILAKVSFPKNVVVEEFTTERCPNCPEPGKWYNEVLNSNPLYRTRVVPICHHSAFGTDWLTRDCDTDLLWLFDLDGQSFAPAAMFDRHAAFKKGLNMDRYEPIVALRSKQDFEDCIKAELNEETHAMVGLKIMGSRTTEEGEEIDVKVTVITDDDFTMENPVLVFYTLEDNIKAQKQEGASGTYYHHHVIRTDNGKNGENITIANNHFEKTYTVTVSPEWNKDKLYFASFVANDDKTDIKNNAVENGAVLYISDLPAGVDMKTADPICETGRYDIHGLRHQAPFEGLNIIVFSDGSTKKIYVKK